MKWKMNENLRFRFCKDIYSQKIIRQVRTFLRLEAAMYRDMLIILNKKIITHNNENLHDPDWTSWFACSLTRSLFIVQTKTPQKTTSAMTTSL